jgi:hypothetical protein
MRRVMLSHDRSQLGRARRAQAFSADARVIGVDPVAARKGGPGSLQGP